MASSSKMCPLTRRVWFSLLQMLHGEMQLILHHRWVSSSHSRHQMWSTCLPKPCCLTGDQLDPQGYAVVLWQPKLHLQTKVQTVPSTCWFRRSFTMKRPIEPGASWKVYRQRIPSLCTTPSLPSIRIWLINGVWSASVPFRKQWRQSRQDGCLLVWWSLTDWQSRAPLFNFSCSNGCRTQSPSSRTEVARQSVMVQRKIDQWQIHPWHSLRVEPSHAASDFPFGCESTF